MAKQTVTPLDRNEFIDILVALRTLSGGYQQSADAADSRGNKEAAARWTADAKRVNALYSKLADADSISYGRVEG